MSRCLVLLLATLLSACQPADPAPVDCGQPQTDMVAYLAGQYVDPSFALTRDSVACLNVGREGYGFGGGWVRSPTVWATATSVQLESDQIPGLGRDQRPTIEIGFVFVPSSPRPGTEPPTDLKVGRYDWGSSQLPDSWLGGLAPRPGVEVLLRRSSNPGAPPDNWSSSGAEQGTEGFFELTRLDPHPANERLVAITGRFTVRLFGRADPWTRARPPILLRQVQFRSYVERPEVVYRKL
jgi:hypothetical protein